MTHHSLYSIQNKKPPRQDGTAIIKRASKNILIWVLARLVFWLSAAADAAQKLLREIGQR